jgi:hypothetical protein
MSDTAPVFSFTPPPPKQNTILSIAFGIGLVIPVFAAVIFGLRMNALQDRNTQLQSQLERTKSELEQARAEIARLLPPAEKARLMPVSITFRQASAGAGYVLQIHNKSGKRMPLKITMTNPTFNKTKTFDAVADAGALPLEIGHLEGWTFTSGDSVEVVCTGFDPIKSKIP